MKKSQNSPRPHIIRLGVKPSPTVRLASSDLYNRDTNQSNIKRGHRTNSALLSLSFFFFFNYCHSSYINTYFDYLHLIVFFLFFL